MISNSHATILFGAVASFCAVIASGCSQSTADGDSAPAVTPVSASSQIDASKYVLLDEPDDAIGVITAREEAKDGDEIVLIARIGGSKKPWIEGRSAFMVIDASMTVVGDGEESDIGEVCLDDCCASLRAECTTLVKFVDEQGRVLPVDARQLLNANVEDLVVIRGRVQRDENEGTFVVIAEGIHVRR